MELSEKSVGKTVRCTLPGLFNNMEGQIISVNKAKDMAEISFGNGGVWHQRSTNIELVKTEKPKTK